MFTFMFSFEVCESLLRGLWRVLGVSYICVYVLMRDTLSRAKEPEPTLSAQ
jgi:hypothetical protein